MSERKDQTRESETANETAGTHSKTRAARSVWFQSGQLSCLCIGLRECRRKRKRWGRDEGRERERKRVRVNEWERESARARVCMCV